MDESSEVRWEMLRSSYSTNLEIWVKTPEAPRSGRGPQPAAVCWMGSCSRPLGPVSPPSSPLMSLPLPQTGSIPRDCGAKGGGGDVGGTAPSMPALICLLPASPSPSLEKEGRPQELAACSG